ncbi:RND transporter [Azorhizobium oxalatiphilum]|uniref:RND transporter n=1 Tax=Azorhizobium oxalatiphilum TaxID=980631 RepID=A0A917FHB1_9HYPH|nr:efflux transporter outer membrane subunit [Azorhizobium oxalatiphilum]GGF77940.1 RND transporter [Azorhizobium oxalatiphilum]
MYQAFPPAADAAQTSIESLSPAVPGVTNPRPIRAARRRALLGLVALAPLLAACVVGPDYAPPPMAMPTNFAAATKAQAQKPAQLHAWWRRLNDPTLDKLVDEAVAHNLDVATAKAAVRQARATRAQQASSLFPSANGSASITRSQNAATGTSASSSGTSTITVDTDGAGSSGTSRTTQWQGGFDASWELDLFGGNRRAVESATYAVEASEAQLRDALVTLIGDLTTYYVQARGYQARIDLATRTAASQRETAQLTRQKFDAGSSSAVDVANAVGQAASTEADIPSLQSSYAQAVHRISVLTGQMPGTLTSAMNRSKPIPSPRLPVPTGVPADILAARPDVRAAERQLAQYTASVGNAQAQLYPSVSLTGSLATSAVKAGDLGKGSTISWSFGPSLTLPIFNGGQLQAGVELAEAQRDQYYVALRSTVLTAMEDVENSLVALSKERQRARSLQESAKAYGDAARLSRALYQTGGSSFLDVLDAERSLYSAQDSLLQSRVLITTDYIALHKALGGGWDGRVDTKTPEVVDVNTGPHLPDANTVSAMWPFGN